MDINATMQELAQYMRIQDETAAIIDGLKDQIKAYMDAEHVDTVTGAEHKATYKTVTSSRVDTTAMKKAIPDIVAEYTRTTSARRFTFA